MFVLQYVYFMPLHVSSTCAYHQEVKIALHSLWYHHTYRCDDTTDRGPLLFYFHFIPNVLISFLRNVIEKQYEQYLRRHHADVKPTTQIDTTYLPSDSCVCNSKITSSFHNYNYDS